MVTIIYDTIGGITAVVYSDVIQMGILLTGIILCMIYAADIKRFLTKPQQSEIKEGFTVIPKAQVSCSRFEDNQKRLFKYYSR